MEGDIIKKNTKNETPPEKIDENEKKVISPNKSPKKEVEEELDEDEKEERRLAELRLMLVFIWFRVTHF